MARHQDADALVAGEREAQAQNNASATVSATVQQPITVTKNNDLSFGNVFPGLDKPVAAPRQARQSSPSLVRPARR